MKTHKMHIKAHHGFTLIEIMIAVTILAIIAAIAIPAYNDYILTARQAEGMDSLATLRLAQIEFFEENDTFFAGANTAALVVASGGRWLPSGWDPALTNAQNQATLNFMYVVAPGPSGDLRVDFTATATGQNLVPAATVLTVSQ